MSKTINCVSKTITCVATVTKYCRIYIPKIICSCFNERALNNIGFFWCNYPKKIIILPVPRNSMRVKTGGSVCMRYHGEPRVIIGCTCRFRKKTACALNLNYKDLVRIVAECDKNGEGQIVIEKYEDGKEAKYGNN